MNAMKLEVLRNEFPFLNEKNLPVDVLRAINSANILISRVDKNLLLRDWQAEEIVPEEINSRSKKIYAYEIGNSQWQSVESPIVTSYHGGILVMVIVEFPGCVSGNDNVEMQYEVIIYKPFKNPEMLQSIWNEAYKAQKAILHKEEAKRLLNRLEFEYPTNQAGGTGSVEFSFDHDKIVIECKEYGCNYNQPYLITSLSNDAIIDEICHLGFTIAQI